MFVFSKITHLQFGLNNLHTKYITHSVQTSVFLFRLVLLLFGFWMKGENLVSGFTWKSLKHPIHFVSTPL